MRAWCSSIGLFSMVLLCLISLAGCPPSISDGERTDASEAIASEQSKEDGATLTDGATHDHHPSDTPPQPDTPPSDTPPSDTPPSDTTPSDTPPSDSPPSDIPPQPDTPPSDAPPSDTPPSSEVYQYPPRDPSKLQMPTPIGSPPPLQPTLLALTYAGGAGKQRIRSISFDADGSIVAAGTGFTIRYDVTGQQGRIEGDIQVSDEAPYSERPQLPGDPGRAYEEMGTGLTLRVGYRQAGSNLQMPIFRAFQGTNRLWALWGHAVQDAIDRGVTADSRCYQAWAMPQGRVGVQCWTDGGNSVLAKDPRDLSVSGFNPDWAKGAYQPSAGGMSSMYALVDPTGGGSVLS